MQNRVRKKLAFLLASFFVLSYQFANIPPSAYKTVTANGNTTVILGGQSIGVNINVDGILILGLSSFYGQDGKKHCPAKEAGLKEGDVILSVNQKDVSTATEFSNIVDQYANSEMNVEYNRNGKTYKTSIKAVKASEDGKYHLGLWARDGTTGMGTLTFIDDEGTFGALGHGISDGDTERLISPCRGNIYFASVNGVQKGTRSNPGELQGSFISAEIGDITSNTTCGIFGKLNEKEYDGQIVKIASKSEIKTGAATIYSSINGNSVEEFAVNIEKINYNSKGNKSMVIRITDKDLISRTGGIVQGMSGSPIIQNGKLVGAVTHVFVNDPTRGYGIFIENMLAEAEKIK